MGSGELEFLLKLDRFSLGNANVEKIYERLLSTIIPQGKSQDSCDPRSQNLSGEDIVRAHSC